MQANAFPLSLQASLKNVSVREIVLREYPVFLHTREPLCRFATTRKGKTLVPLLASNIIHLFI